MNCTTCRSEIEDIAAGERLGREARVHVDDCGNCRTFFSERTALREMIGSLEPVTAPPDFDFRLRARLAGVENTGGSGTVWSRFAWKNAGPAFAATLVVALVSAFAIYQLRQPGTDSTVSTQPGAEQVGSQAQDQAQGLVPIISAPPAPVLADNPKPSNNDVQSPTSASNVDPSGRTGVHNRSGQSRTNAATKAIASRDTIQTLESSGREARTITPPGIPNPLSTRNTVLIPVAASLKPVMIGVTDRRVPSGKVTVRAVTFGSEDLIVQTDSQALFAPASGSVW